MDALALSSLIRLFALMLAAATLVIDSPALLAQSPSPIEYQRYDVDIQLEDDGDFRVQIRQRVEFDGEFERAFLEIPKEFTNGIQDVAVFLADGDVLSPADHTLTESEDAVSIAWTYPRTQPGDIREFAIDYTASGALWVYNDRDILRWDVVHADRSGVPVQSSRVTIHLPSYVPPDAIQAAGLGSPYAVETLDNAMIFTAVEELPDGQFFNVQVDFPHGLVNAAIQDWQKSVDAGQLAIDLERVDVQLWVRDNGMLTVREEMDVAVSAGVLYDAYREIRRLYLDDVTRLRVSHDDRLLSVSDSPCDECLVISSVPRDDAWVRYNRNLNQVEINELHAGYVRADWSIAPVYPGETARFAVEYAVRGAVRQEDQAQSFDWQVVPDLGVQPAAASVRIYPPEGVTAKQLVVTNIPPDVTLRSTSKGYLIAESVEPLPPGELWNLHVSMPRNSVANVVPLWQAGLEHASAEQIAAQVGRARRQLTLLVAAILSAVLLLLGAIVGWFKWGRRRLREQLGGYVSEPPSGLAPGIVAYLVDGAVRPNGLLASLLQLGALGLVEIDLHNGLALRLVRKGEVSEAELHTSGGNRSGAPNTHLVYLFNRVILPAATSDKSVPLEELSGSLQRALPEFYSAMAYDAQTFLLRRGSNRSRLHLSPLVLMLAWFAAASAIMYATFRFQLPSGVAVVLVSAAFLVFFILHATRELGTGQAYSDRGAAERAEWLKFKNYLADLKKYGDHAAARQVMERYFAYAVALGVQELILAHATSRSGRPPAWLASPPSPVQTDSSHSLMQPSSAQANAKSDLSRPSANRRPPIVRRVRPAAGLAGMSRAVGSSLAQTSASLGALLSTAAGSEPDGTFQITLKSVGGTREMDWEAGTPINSILDDILNQSMHDTRRIVQERSRPSSPSRSGPATRSSPSRSSGGFSAGGSAFRSSGGSRSSRGSRSSSRPASSSSSRRSGGGGRSGFG